MSETMAPAFVTPSSGVPRVPTVSIVPTGKPLSEGIRLVQNNDLFGFILEHGAEGLWLSPLENTTVPRARGGSSLRNRRWAEGDVFLPISLHSPNPESMYDMFAQLVGVVTDEDDYFDVVVFDPYSQEIRRRTVLYDSGLEDINEVSFTYHSVGVTAKFLSPWWRGPERVVTERIAPPVKPLITADPGRPVDRWPDPDFSDTAAYAPWLPVDGGLVKWGTGQRHGGFFSSRLIAVSYGEVLEVSAQLSFMDGPHVGSVSVEVQAVDDKGDVIPYSARQAVLLPRSGRFTGAYVVPQNAEYVMVGVFTEPDVHANTRARVENIQIRDGGKHVTSYKWAGAPHASESIKKVNGVEVARNIFPDPRATELSVWRSSSGVSEIEVVPRGDMFKWLPPFDTVTRFRAKQGATGMPFVYRTIDATPGQWYAIRSSIQSPQGAGGRMHIQFRSAGNSTLVSGGHTENNPPADGQDYVHTIQAPNEPATLWVLIWPPENPPLTDWTYFTGIGVAVADSEQAALDSVLEYFDGSTDDVVIEPSVEPVLTGAYSFPFFPIFLADSTVQGEHELRVEGDAPVWPVWEITGPGRDVEIIGPDGSRLFVEGEVTSPITIVTEPRKRSIRDASGLIWDRMKPGDDQFFPLEPGEQVVKMTMVGGNPESTIKAVYSENWKTPRGTAKTLRGI